MCIVTPILNTRALVKLCQHNDVARLSVFGSFARGEGTERSDVDLLVEFRKRNSLLALIALERKMYLRESIERDLRVVYEAR
jgi:predicted nucleotidyltransferase